MSKGFCAGVVAASDGFSWAAVITGAAVAIFAFVLATVRDEVKARRQAKQRDSSILSVVRAEIAMMIGLVENDQALVEEDLGMLQRNATLTNPIDPVVTGVWDLVKVTPPKTLAKREALLTSILDIARRATQVNEIIRSRESFRVANPPHPNFPGFAGHMKAYDELLRTFLAELLTALRKLEEDLQSSE